MKTDDELHALAASAMLAIQNEGVTAAFIWLRSIGGENNKDTACGIGSYDNSRGASEGDQATALIKNLAEAYVNGVVNVAAKAHEDSPDKLFGLMLSMVIIEMIDRGMELGPQTEALLKGLDIDTFQ